MPSLVENRLSLLLAETLARLAPNRYILEGWQKWKWGCCLWEITVPGEVHLRMRLEWETVDVMFFYSTNAAICGLLTLLT